MIRKLLIIFRKNIPENHLQLDPSQGDYFPLGYTLNICILTPYIMHQKMKLILNRGKPFQAECVIRVKESKTLTY